MIEEATIKKELSEYFEYIKEVYLILFDKILNDEKKQKIKEINSDVIEIDLESEYRIKVRKNIKFCLNIDEFIKNNNFEKENFKDIDEKGLRRINYYLDNKENIMKLAKDSLLENMILFFLGNKNLDVITLGTVNLIAANMSKKYNLPFLNNYEKESEIVSNLVDIIGEKNLYKFILNDEMNDLKKNYNKFVNSFNSDDSLENIIDELNDIYSNYGKNKDKVYFADSLYYYQKIDYSKIIKKINLVKDTKTKILEIMYARLESIVDCMKELDRYKIIYSNEEKVSLYYSSLDLKRIVGKINETNNIGIFYDEVLKIEKDIYPLADKIWMYYLSSPLEDHGDEQCWYLVENFSKGYNKSDKRFLTTNLITTDNILLPSDDNRYQYGFIYKIKENSIIYKAPDSIVYREFKKTNDYKSNINTIDNDSLCLEIEEQNYSILLTPRNLMIKTIKQNKKYNSVLVDKNNTEVAGIFCVTDGSDDNICYKKALDLSEKFELPLITLGVKKK